MDIEYEKQKNQCTFQPELYENKFTKRNYNSNNNGNNGQNMPKNSEKEILRMRNARKERENINNMI